MTLSEMKHGLIDLQNKLEKTVEEGSSKTTMAEINAANDQAAVIKAQIKNMKERIAMEEAKQIPGKSVEKTDTEKVNLRATREYTRAFCNAIRTGYVPGRSAYQEEFKVLHDVITESDNQSGGYIIPVEMDTEIRKKLKSIAPIIDMFMNYNTTSKTGWLTVGAAASAGFSALSSTGTTPRVPAISSTDSQLFSRVAYSMTTYGLTIPVEQELLNDETSNVVSYLTNLLADKDAITKVGLLLGTMPSTGVSATSSDVFAKIKAALNVTLDPAHSARAIVLTNQDGYAQLDGLVDSNGRDLLQPMPGDPTTLAIRGRKVVVVPNWQMASTSNVAPIYVVDPQAYACLFQRGAMELASTDIGGDAFDNYETRIRAITRLDAKVVDSAAACLISTTL